MAVERTHARVDTDCGSDRGAVIVHVTVALIALMAFSTFVVDYGVLWVARRQAQNAADAAALAGAMAYAFDDPYNRGGTNVAVQAAFAVTQRHGVWGEVPSVVPATDITFPLDAFECKFLLEILGSECIRVDVYRDSTRGNPLPVFFGQLIGVSDQGVRATASARLFRANVVRCMRPWAIPDSFPAGNPSAYLAPSGTDLGSTRSLDVHLGEPFVLSGAHPVTAATMVSTVTNASLFRLDLALDGGVTYEANVASCLPTPRGLGDVVTPDPDDLLVETTNGVATLRAADPGASWNTVTKRIDGSCAQLRTCLPYTLSPRLVPIVVFDPKVYAETGIMRIVNIIGFFVDHMSGDDVVGAFTTLPGSIDSFRPHIFELASFVKTISLYR